MAETESGYYCKVDNTLYYADRSNLTNWLVACNEPNCSGKSIVCPARFQSNFRLNGNQIETIRNPQFFHNGGENCSAMYTMRMDGTELQQKFVLDSSNMDDGGSSGTWLLEDRILAFYSHMQADGSFANSLLQMDDNGTYTLYTSKSVDLETPFIAPAQDWCAMRGDLALYISLLHQDDALSHLYRPMETSLEEIPYICNYDLRGAYLSGNTLLHFVPNSGYYEADLNTTRDKKYMDAQLKDSIAFHLTEQYIIETNRLIDQTGAPAEALLYDGKTWHTISLPEAMLKENVNLFPVSIASDRIFFTTYPDNIQTNLYYLLLTDDQPTLTLCWELPRNENGEYSIP